MRVPAPRPSVSGAWALRRSPWISALMTAVFALALLTCSRGQSGPLQRPAAGSWAYTVKVDPALTTMDVRLCFADRGEAPKRLVADNDESDAFLGNVTRPGGEAVPVVRDGEDAPYIDTSALGPGDCILYAVDMTRLVEEGPGRSVRRSGDAVLASVGLWLWRPLRLPDGVEPTVRFVLPEGFDVSTPWPAEPGSARTYRVPATTYRWRSQIVVGAFDQARFDAAGATFSVAIMDGPRSLTDAGLQRWITAAAETVALLYERFPRREVQIVVLPVGGAGEPVYFGLASRGGGAGVTLLISEAEDEKFVGEWVAIHEFLHLGMPFIRGDDVWLSEGFVTYYTSVLRTRAGFRDEHNACESILAGFGRGRRSASNATLREASRDMHERMAYQRVYWGGAAVALLADVGLRQRPGGAGGLDHAMRALQACCATSPRKWGADEVLEIFDESLGGGSFLRDLAARELERAGFIELEPALAAMGVEADEAGVDLTESGDAAALRRAIFLGASSQARADRGDNR